MKKINKIIAPIIAIAMIIAVFPKTGVTNVAAEAEDVNYYVVVEGKGFQIIDEDNAEISRDAKELVVYVEDNKGNRYTPQYVAYETLYSSSENLHIDISYKDIYREPNVFNISVEGNTGDEFWLKFSKIHTQNASLEKSYFVRIVDDIAGEDTSTVTTPEKETVPEKETTKKETNPTQTTEKSYPNSFTIGSIKYGLIDQKKKEASVCEILGKASNVVVPDTVQYQGITYKVVAISTLNNKNLKKIKIGKNVRNIMSAFDNCTKLKTVKFAKKGKLKNIGSFAFARCKSLKKIQLPKTIKNIKSQAFCSSGITSITIPNSVEEIGEDAFEGCKKLKKVVIGKKVRMIGFSAFSECSRLQKVTISGNYLKIKSFAFSFCTSLKSAKLKAMTIFLGKDCFCETSDKLIITVPKLWKSDYRKKLKKTGIAKTATLKTF